MNYSAIDVERFNKFVAQIPPSDCWIWTGATAQGYGRFRLNGKIIQAHQFSYIVSRKGHIASDKVVDHITCKNKLCVNPLHLRIVTRAMNNTENSNSPSAVNKSKTRCIRGHEFTKGNTYLYRDGGRDCRICRRDRNREYKRQKRRISQ